MLDIKTNYINVFSTEMGTSNRTYGMPSKTLHKKIFYLLFKIFHLAINPFIINYTHLSDQTGKKDSLPSCLMTFRLPNYLFVICLCDCIYLLLILLSVRLAKSPLFTLWAWRPYNSDSVYKRKALLLQPKAAALQWS